MSKPWLVVALLWCVALLNYLDRQLITNLGEDIKRQFAIGDDDFGLLSAVFLWVYGLVSAVAGYVADRIGRRLAILASLAVWSAATLWTGCVNSFEEMLAARAVMGISEAFYMPAAVALIADYHRGRTRSRATGLHLSGTYVGAILGGLGGMMAVTLGGWRQPFLLFGVVGVLYAIALAFVLRNPPTQAGSKAVSFSPVVYGELLSIRGFVLLLMMNATFGTAFWMLRNWLPEFFRQELGVPQKWAGVYGTSAFSLAAFVGMLAAGTLSDHLAVKNPRARTLIPAVVYTFAGFAFVGLGLIPQHAVPLLIGCVIVCGMAHGSMDANLMPAVCLQVPERSWATAYGLLNLVGTTCGGIMTFIGGTLKQQHVPFADTLLFLSLFVWLTAGLLAAVKPRTP